MSGPMSGPRAARVTRGSVRGRTGGRRPLLAIAAAILALGAATPLSAQWTQAHEQFYLPADHNWVFRQNYNGADRLFNAFDYGHAILYEELYRRPNGPAERLEVDRYEFLTERLLKRPPRVPLEEGAIEVAYAKLAPEAKEMFHWAHILHRQLYDILADERLSPAEKDAAVAEVLAYYKSRPDVAFSSQPKGMDLMDGQYYSLAFRQRYPKFNGLIWAYHWLQVGLYEPLLLNENVAGRTTGVNATVGRFWQMLEDAPRTMPHLMPMTAGVAPTFARRYPEASIIFDNLHMMHDVISDILASPEVPRERKRAEILRAAAAFRDDTTEVISVEEWAMMGEMMGVNNMGGPAVGFLAELPEPTVPYGMSMAGMDHSAGGHGGAPAAEGHAGHGEGAAAAPAHAGMQHDAAPPAAAGAGAAAAGHVGMQHGAAPEADGEHMRRMHELHTRMLADPVIRARLKADPELSRMVEEMEAAAPAAASLPLPAGTDAADREQAIEFIVRLLSDPEVEARVHSDPELHRLWADPEVQRRLAELRERQPAAAPAAPAHQH
jgi:hypothetical protein